MADARPLWPSPSAERRLADALLARGSPAVADEVAAAYLGPLTAYLCAAHPNCDPEECATAAGEAITDVCRHPTPFDPTGLPLGAYLRFVAERELRGGVPVLVAVEV